jgi:sugar phosphate isomerase/epimerase
MSSSPARFQKNAEVITDLFQKLGKWVLSCHAKDLKRLAEYNVHFQEVVPGRGQIDYRTYLRQLASAPVEAPLMLEHLKTAEEYAEGREYIRRVASEIGAFV